MKKTSTNFAEDPVHLSQDVGEPTLPPQHAALLTFKWHYYSQNLELVQGI